MTLKIGTWLYDGGRYGGLALVADIHGEIGSARTEALAGGAIIRVIERGATLDVIYDDGREYRGMPEDSPYRLPWKVLDREPADAATIAEFRARVAIRNAEEKAKKDEAVSAYAAEKARLEAAYPNLVRAKDAKGGALIAAATNARALLKAAFPDVKFSVKTERFSGGDAMRVKWVDGPKVAEVEAIVRRFAAGYFDGMEDIYNYEHSPWTDLFGDAKYVSCDRDNSDAALLAAASAVIEEYRIGKLRGDEPASAEKIVALFKNGNLWGEDEWIAREVREHL